MISNEAWIKKVFPLLQWWPLLNRESARADIVAGVTGGVLIPRKHLLASLAGLPPEYGLYTSMFPVLFAALFGSSWHALSGPNTALCILLAHSIEPYASVGSTEWIQYAITLGFMAGLVQLSIGLLRLGVVFNYFSHAVMVALVTGVGIIIIISQLGNFMGVLMNIAEPIENAIPQVFYAVERANWFAVGVGAITVLSGLYLKMRKPNWPFMIIAVVVGMLAAELKHHFAWRQLRADAAEPFISHFFHAYCEKFPNPQEAFRDITKRNRFYMALGELRIARNPWLIRPHRLWLIEEAMRCLREPA